MQTLNPHSATVLLPVLLLLVGCLGTPEQQHMPVSIITADDPNARAIGDELNRVFTPIAKDRDLAGVIRIEKGGTFIAEATFGYADIQAQRPNQSSTLFNVGSITKSLTASLILILERDGLINFDDKLSQYFPGSGVIDHITIRQVLEHKAGLIRDIPKEYITEIERDGLIVWIDRQELLFTPGTDSSYSNVGYQLLAKLAEAVSRQSYAQLLKERVYLPAGITGAKVVDKEAAQSPDVATPYEPGPPPLDLREPADIFMSVGDSGALLSAEQLIDWVETIRAAKIANLLPEDEAPIGNVRIRGEGTARQIGLQGSTPGGGAATVLLPEENLAVAYAFNIASYPLWGLEPALVAISRGETLTELPSPRPQPIPLNDAHRALAGRFIHPQFGPVTINHSAEGMTLTLDTLGFDFVLNPIADGALHWRVFNTILKQSVQGKMTAQMQLIGSPKQVFELSPAPNE